MQAREPSDLEMAAAAPDLIWVVTRDPAVAAIARALGAPAVATVGKIRVEPDQINVVPARAVFTVDLRHADLVARRATLTVEPVAGDHRVLRHRGDVAGRLERGHCLAVVYLHRIELVAIDN